MPLIRRRPVALLPLPDLDGLSEDHPVFYLKATGEIFLDYESYSARLSFLLTRSFQCEYSGKSHLDYFTALQSEKAESQVVRERFPDELKGRVLASVQFQVMGRLDKLVDLVYERYKDRFFVGEKIFVDLVGDKYYARVARVFPPQTIRDAHHASTALTESTAETAMNPADDYSTVIHKIGTNLDVDEKQASASDPAAEYLYTVQLMDEEHKFEGSFMEVKHKNLSRDRLSFSKSILKRYMRECVQRDASIAAPWTVKPSIARAFGIETQQSEDIESKNKEIKEGKLARRRKAVPDGPPTEPATKRRKTDDGIIRPPSDGPKKAIKYPIEDLDLDPMSIHDGRILRRTKTEVPTLPPKPLPKRELPVPREHFDLFLETWNMLNTFSKPLFLSPFTIDDYAGALAHTSRAPGQECVLLAEIHASLTNIIGTDASRVLGSSSILATMLAHGGIATGNDDDAPVKKEDGDETPRGSPAPEGTEDKVETEGDAVEVDELDEDETPRQELTPEEIFFGKLIKRGIQYGKRWDRQAKLKSETGRKGWERHLIGALCQRGGPYFVENFVEIMKHLFEGDPILLEEHTTAENGNGHENGTTNGGDASTDGAKATEDSDEPPKSSQLTDIELHSDMGNDDYAHPEEQYLTLPLADKLAIINYLITLVMGSKPIRAYLDEADKELTDLRKQRADVNKDRRALQERKLNESKKSGQNAKADSALNGKPISPATSTATAPKDVRDSPAPSVPASRATSPSVRNGGAEDDEDQLVSSDGESSIAPSEGGGAAARQAQREAALAKQRLSKLAAVGKPGNSTSKPTKAKGSLTLDEQIEENTLLDEHVEVQFRRYLGVSRCRALGKDRFHCKYWWFDGIGGMDISKAHPDGSRVPYQTGRIFVQGPSEQDWQVLADVQEGEEGNDMMLQRRMREEVVDEKETLVGVGQWGYYETPEEIDSLLSWLNSKGIRELALIKAITRWREFIAAGAEERRKDLENPERPRYDPHVSSTGRRSRNKAENELPSTYLGYRNQRKKY
ncbi:uncharacterized protein JCM15063_002698 [Sporobolomyces koalae]|uniref:uncharacterized protein n=1 Tax=Sporobolomyces koalae TaxID=500713 RepID=UPI003171CC7C